MSFPEEYDTRFPHSTSGLPPSPTIENPGQVFPPTDPDKCIPVHTPSPVGTTQYLGNPYLMNDAFEKLDRSLLDVITILEMEESNANIRERNKDSLLEKFREWREYLDIVRSGSPSASTHASRRVSPLRPQRNNEGGMFVD